MKRIETCLSAEEWECVKKWLTSKGYTTYRLVKEAVLEKVSNEPPKKPGTQDRFVQEDPA